jgi:hypothetical protein
VMLVADRSVGWAPARRPRSRCCRRRSRCVGGLGIGRLDPIPRALARIPASSPPTQVAGAAVRIRVRALGTLRVLLARSRVCSAAPRPAVALARRAGRCGRAGAFALLGLFAARRPARDDRAVGWAVLGRIAVAAELALRRRRSPAPGWPSGRRRACSSFFPPPSRRC